MANLVASAGRQNQIGGHRCQTAGIGVRARLVIDHQRVRPGGYQCVRIAGYRFGRYRLLIYRSQVRKTTARDCRNPVIRKGCPLMNMNRLAAAREDDQANQSQPKDGVRRQDAAPAPAAAPGPTAPRRSLPSALYLADLEPLRPHFFTCARFPGHDYEDLYGVRQANSACKGRPVRKPTTPSPVVVL